MWQVLDQHPHCLLRRQDLTGYRINWANKAANLKELALELNLSLDSWYLLTTTPPNVSWFDLNSQRCRLFGSRQNIPIFRCFGGQRPVRPALGQQGGQGNGFDTIRPKRTAAKSSSGMWMRRAF